MTPQHAHPSRSFSMWMLIGSWKSPLNSSDSSCSRAFLAITTAGCQQAPTVQEPGNMLTFECLFHIDGLLCARLKVGNTPLGLAEGHGSLGRDLRGRKIGQLQCKQLQVTASV